VRPRRRSQRAAAHDVHGGLLGLQEHVLKFDIDLSPVVSSHVKGVSVLLRF
jgi:hypothetical protein